MVFVPLKDGAYCMHENSKNRSLKRMDGPDCMLTGFLTFLPEPKKASPIIAAAHGLQGADAGRRWFLPGRHIPCSRWNGHGLRRPLPRVFNRITCLSAPRNEKERTHMRTI